MVFHLPAHEKADKVKKEGEPFSGKLVGRSKSIPTEPDETRKFDTITTMTPREMQIAFVTEIITICRSIDRRSKELATFLGADSIYYFEDEVSSLWKVILDMTGASAKRNEYYDRLVELGAAKYPWRCLHMLHDQMITPMFDPETTAEWLLKYAAGEIFGVIDDLASQIDDPLPFSKTPKPTNEELVKAHGLLRPVPK